jgi:hypothetical protein
LSFPAFITIPEISIIDGVIDDVRGGDIDINIMVIVVPSINAIKYQNILKA